MSVRTNAVFSNRQAQPLATSPSGQQLANVDFIRDGEISDFQVTGNGYVHGVALAGWLHADGLHEMLKSLSH
jgi:hypothetical protein